MPWQARSLVLLLALVPAAKTQFSAFEWSLLGSNSPNHVPHAVVDGESVRIDGLIDWYCWWPTAWVQAVAPVDGRVTFTAQFTNNNPSPNSEAPVAFLDGAFFTPPGTAFPSGDYPFAFDVLEGQSFGFGVRSGEECNGPPGSALVQDLLFAPRTWFEVPGAIDPRPWLDVASPPGAAGFGAVLAACGDLDGDRVGDVLVGAPVAGRGFVVSGADGSVLLELALAPDAGLALAGAGDFDGDGRPDLVAGLPHATPGGADAGRIEVRSGLDGALLAARDGTPGALLGAALAPAGDVDGDGFADVIVAAPGVLGHVLLLGGPDAHELLRLDGGYGFGVAVAVLGDASGDGLPDVAIAVSDASARVDVYALPTGELVSTASTIFACATARLAPLGDHDGDGLADYAWGLPTTFQPVPYTDVEFGRAWIRSGASGAAITEWAGSSTWDVIGDALAAGDWNGDGLEDVACVGFVDDDSGYAISRRVRIVSGAPGGALLHELLAGPADDFGRALAAPGDLDGDGITDLALGAPGSDLGLRLVHALDGLGIPRLHGTGELLPGATFSVDVSHARPFEPLLLVASPLRVDLPLKGGLLVPYPDLLVALSADVEGRVALSTRWPAGIPGPFTFWMQAWVADPDAAQGFTASNGLGGLQP